MSQVFNKLYEFGGFRLDPVERLLWRGEETLILPPKVFDTLLVLLEKDGRVVSKSELMEAIWGDTFVEESNMSQNIYTLRRTLGVDGQGRQFIETVPRRGYRFAVPVTLLDESANDSGAGQGAEVAAEPASPPEVLTNPVKAYDPLPSAENRPDSAALSPSTDESQAAATTEASPLPPASPSPLPPSGQTHRLSAFRIGLWAGLGVLLLLALGSGVYQLVIRRGEKQQVRIAPIEQVRFQRLTDSGDIVFPVLSPNGEFLAYVRQEEREETVWVKQIATGSAVQTLPPSRKGYRCLAFSPDGKYLFFREEAEAGGIYQTSVFGGTPKKVADNVWSDFSISPDGRQFAFVRRDNARNAHLLMLSNLDGSGEYEVSARQLPLNYRGIPTWSPDGTKIVIPAGLQQQFLPKLLTVDLASGQETELKTPRWRAISHALWMPDGKHLLVAARESNESTSQLWMLPYPDGEIRRLTNDLESYFWLSLSSDGRMLVTRQQRIVSHLWALPDGDVKKARQLTFGRRNFDGYVGLAWAPDNRIIFSVRNDHVTDLYSMNPDGSNRIQLTENAGLDNSYPVVSMDGRYIVFISNRSGTRHIWRMNSDGRNPKQLTFGETETESALYAVVSPDSREVFFIKYGSGPATIWKTPIEGGTGAPVSPLTNATAEGFLSISPDGKWMAYRHISAQPEAKGDERTLRIGVLPTEGNAEPRLFDLPMRRPIIHWTADSTAFDYAAGTFNASSLWRLSLTGGEPRRLGDFPDRIYNFIWSGDGKTLVVSSGKQQGDAIMMTNLP